MKNYKGLSSQEVLESRNSHGDNSLAKIEQESLFSKFIGSFKDPIIGILLVALVINVVLTFFGHAEWYESVGIAVAVLLATLVATLSEHKNEESFQKLQEEASQIMVKVYRDGSLIEINIGELVKEDMVLIQTGDKVPADCIIVEGEVKVSEASLNGESREVRKYLDENTDSTNIDLENYSMVFRETVVQSGEAVVKVIRVGDETFYGSLAKELNIDEEDSPLQEKLGVLAGQISMLGYIGASLIFVSYMLKKSLLDTGSIGAYMALGSASIVADLIQALILAVIIIVVAVPEGLPMMISMVLSLNMRKLLKDNVLVRKLIGIETAGSLNILFTDKTGTLTKGKLDVVTVLTGDGKQFDKLVNVGKVLSNKVVEGLRINTNAVVSKHGGIVEIIGGNATEKALVGFVKDEEIKEFETLNEIQFDSSIKYSAKEIQGRTLVKGAPEVLLKKCKGYINEDGTILPLDMAELDRVQEELANRSIRLIALAESEGSIVDGELPQDLYLVAILGIRDDLREESPIAVKKAQDAGIQVVMITGDRKETAIAIAKECNILSQTSDVCLTSEELCKMSDDEIKSIIPNLKVVARALPTDKSRLVRLAQELELVVGM